MGFLAFVFGVVVFCLAVTGQYIFGRIVLPEVGLQAVEWHILFWGEFFVILFCSPLLAIKSLF